MSMAADNDENVRPSNDDRARFGFSFKKKHLSNAAAFATEPDEAQRSCDVQVGLIDAGAEAEMPKANLTTLLDTEFGDPESVLALLRLKPKADKYDFKYQIEELKNIVKPLKEALSERLKRESALREAMAIAEEVINRRFCESTAKLAEQRRLQEEALARERSTQANVVKAWQAKVAESDRQRLNIEMGQERAFAEMDRKNKILHAQAIAEWERRVHASKEDLKRQSEEASRLLQQRSEAFDVSLQELRAAAQRREEELVAEWTGMLENASLEAAGRESKLVSDLEREISIASGRDTDLRAEHAVVLCQMQQDAQEARNYHAEQLGQQESQAEACLEEMRALLVSEIKLLKEQSVQREAEVQAQLARQKAEADLREQELGSQYIAQMKDLEARALERERELLAQAEQDAANANRIEQELKFDHFEALNVVKASAQERERELLTEAAQKAVDVKRYEQEIRQEMFTQLKDVEVRSEERERELVAQCTRDSLDAKRREQEIRFEMSAHIKDIESRAQQRERELTAEAARHAMEAKRRQHDIERELTAQGKDAEARALERERALTKMAADKIAQLELVAQQRELDFGEKLDRQLLLAQQSSSDARIEYESAASAARSREDELKGEIRALEFRIRQLIDDHAAARDRTDAQERKYQQEILDASGRIRRLEGDLASERASRDREAMARATLHGEHTILQSVAEQRQSKCQELGAQVAALLERISELQVEVRSSESERERLRDAVGEEQAALQKSREDIERLGSQLSAARESLAGTTAELVAVRDHSRRLSVGRRELELEYNSYKEHNSTSNHAQMEAITELRLTVDKLTQKVDSAQVELLLKSTDVASHQRCMKRLEEQLALAETSRRALHNTIQELRGNIRVFCRVRPSTPELPIALALADDAKLVLSHSGEQYPFVFDKVFGPSSEQDDLFIEVSELVQSALDGYKVCIFAYGQTGSGKTYTMQGGETPSSSGLIPRSLRQIFKVSEEMRTKGWQWSLKASFMEVYNEVIRDLLRDESLTNNRGGSFATPQCHTIKHDTDWGMHVTNMTCVPVSSVEHIDSLTAKAAKLRAVGKTELNAQSSRSHSIFTLYLSGSNSELDCELRGALHLVDLAGSERLDRSGAVGDRLKETQNINKSLSSLAGVFAAKAENRSHVPFRDSKLTHLMEPCLSGQGKTLMVVNVGPEPESSHETLCSLRFASQVSQCTTGGKPKRSAKALAARLPSARQYAVRQ